jgi:hypothetical protein
MRSNLKLQTDYIAVTRNRFQYYYALGLAAIDQCNLEDLKWRSSEFDNSIAIIVKHLERNMRSRWTDFLTSDGDKILAKS